MFDERVREQTVYISLSYKGLNIFSQIRELRRLWAENEPKRDRELTRPINANDRKP